MVREGWRLIMGRKYIYSANVFECERMQKDLVCSNIFTLCNSDSKDIKDLRNAVDSEGRNHNSRWQSLARLRRDNNCQDYLRF